MKSERAKSKDISNDNYFFSLITHHIEEII